MTTLYEEIFDEVSKYLDEDEAAFLAESLAHMDPARVRRLFDIVDNHEPSETEQGLIPIPAAYREH